MDVLLLLDCCAAASAAPTVGATVTETIAACGLENIAPQPGRHSFTNTLIEVLEDWIDAPPFSTAILHNKVLSILKHERLERAQNGKRRKVERLRTPIYIMGTADPRLPSVELCRRSPVVTLPLMVSNDERLSPLLPPTVPSRKAYEADSLDKTTEGSFDVPRVIISLALESDQTLNSETCEKWLASCPALIKYAMVEAVYKSFSTLLLLSIPIFIWNLFPEGPACSFVGYTRSPNMMQQNTKCDIVENCFKTGIPDATGVSIKRCLDCEKGATCDPEAPNCSRCRLRDGVCVCEALVKNEAFHDDYARGPELQTGEQAFVKDRFVKNLEPVSSSDLRNAGHVTIFVEPPLHTLVNIYLVAVLMY
jgi:hypothetical protein